MNTTIISKKFGLCEIDSMIDDLSRLQFSILSDISCGAESTAICQSNGINDEAFKDEVYSLIEAMGVDDIQTAVEYYSTWIEDFEGKLQQMSK